jgi:cell division protein FtsB
VNGAPSAPTRELQTRLRRRAALREVAYLLALLTSAAAVYTVVVLLPSHWKTRDLRRHRDEVALELQATHERVEVLERDSHALQEDPWAVERTLRQRLGYLRCGERVFVPPPALE